MSDMARSIAELTAGESEDDRVRRLESELALLRARMASLAPSIASSSDSKRKNISDWWCSPPEITNRLEEFFHGAVDVDPCSNPRSIVLSRMALTSGGLVLPWKMRRPVDRTFYENFPYSQPDAWTSKLLAELRSGNVVEGIRLSMFSCSAQWWEDQCYKPRRNPRILALKRIAFLDPEATEAGQKRMACRFMPALIYFGPRWQRFDKVFAALTRWSTWGRSCARR